VALSVERLIVRERNFPASGGGDAGLAASFGEGGPEPIAVIASIGQQRLGRRQGVEDQPSAFVIAHLTFAEQQDEGLAGGVADGVKL